MTWSKMTIDTLMFGAWSIGYIALAYYVGEHGPWRAIWTCCSIGSAVVAIYWYDRPGGTR